MGWELVVKVVLDIAVLFDFYENGNPSRRAPARSLGFRFVFVRFYVLVESPSERRRELLLFRLDRAMAISNT